MQHATPSVEELFYAALEFDTPASRSAFLDRSCGDAEVRRRVERLLALEPEANRFLEAPASSATVTAAHDPRPGVEGLGTTIGPYKLLEQLGEGGMGAVYVAEQTEPVRRRVALKVIKPGMDSKQVIARFEAERQALAMMDHPNIAKVLDGGMAPSGRPYFVMELVRGLPITEYCDREQLTIPERLELFILVCRAVQHAHQKGVIHRDLKPSNILVTVIDGVGVPKVIDFGIAKATGGALTDKTVYTGFQQFIGTPLYMSPEQADLAGVDVDTRSDIYSLGVLLYELLTGTTPLNQESFRKAAFDEVRRIVREEEPPKPSTRLGTLGQSLSTVSARRKAEPRQLSRAVRGELDWVVMRALEKDRRRRYETAGDFAADVLRYLDDRPVEACPPSSWYRFSKYARRNRGALATAGGVALALVAGTAISTWQAVRATRAMTLASRREREARDAAAESRAVLGFLVRDMLGASAPEKALGRQVTVAEALARAEEKVASAFPDRPLVEAGVRQAMAEVYNPLGRYDLARRHASRSYELRLALLGPEDPETLTSLNVLGITLWFQAKTADDPRPLLAEARKLLEQALTGRRRVLGSDDPQTLDTANNLANVLSAQGELGEAGKLFEQTLEVQRRVLGPEHRDTLGSMGNLATVLYREGKKEEACRMFEQTLETARRALGPEHPQTLLWMNNLAAVLSSLGRDEEELRLNEQALEIRRRILGPKHYDTFVSRCKVVLNLLQAPGRTATERARALELTKEWTDLQPEDAHGWRWRGVAEYCNGAWDAAIRSEERCIKLRGGQGSAFQDIVFALAYARKGEMHLAHVSYERARPAIEQGTILAPPSDTPRWLVDEVKARLAGTELPGPASASSRGP